MMSLPIQAGEGGAEGMMESLRNQKVWISEECEF